MALKSKEKRALMTERRMRPSETGGLRFAEAFWDGTNRRHLYQPGAHRTLCGTMLPDKRPALWRMPARLPRLCADCTAAGEALRKAAEA